MLHNKKVHVHYPHKKYNFYAISHFKTQIIEYDAVKRGSERIRGRVVLIT